MPAATLEDRLAARLLGVDVDADARQIRGQFRRLAKAVHPDSSVAQGCVDLGRLSEAKDRLLARAEARDELDAMTTRFVAAQAARERHLIAEQRSRREAQAARKVEAMRAHPVAPNEDVAAAAVSGSRTDFLPFEPLDRIGVLVDLAG